MQLRYSLRGALWLLIYLIFILAPLFALLIGTFPSPPRDFWGEFAVAIGYSGLAMMGLQFGLTARFRYVTEPWGEDVIYHFSPPDIACRNRPRPPACRHPLRGQAAAAGHA